MEKQKSKSTRRDLPGVKLDRDTFAIIEIAAKRENRTNEQIVRLAVYHTYADVATFYNRGIKDDNETNAD